MKSLLATAVGNAAVLAAADTATAKGLLARGGVDIVVAAINAVARGEACYSTSFCWLLSATGSHPERLSDRELQVLDLTADAARRLCVAPATVEFHRRRIMQKLGVGNAAEMEFVLQHDDRIIPVEVKSGLSVTAKSLAQYRKKYGPDISVRLSMQNVRKDADLLNLPPPLYLADKLKMLCERA